MHHSVCRRTSISPCGLTRSSECSPMPASAQGVHLFLVDQFEQGLARHLDELHLHRLRAARKTFSPHHSRNRGANEHRPPARSSAGEIERTQNAGSRRQGGWRGAERRSAGRRTAVSSAPDSRPPAARSDRGERRPRRPRRFPDRRTAPGRFLPATDRRNRSPLGSAGLAPSGAPDAWD